MDDHGDGGESADKCECDGMCKEQDYVRTLMMRALSGCFCHLSAKRHRSTICGKTPYERRFGQPFKGLIIQFGSLVEYHPFTAKDQ